MQDHERIKAEATAIKLIMSSEGMKVILSELEKRIRKAQQPIPMTDSMWSYKMAMRTGEAKALGDIKAWVEGRSKINPDAFVIPPTEA